MSVRVECYHCGAVAKITSSNKLARTVKDLYVRCEDCGSLTVVTLSYSHTVHPPINSTHAMALHLVNNMTEQQRQKLIQGDLLSQA